VRLNDEISAAHQPRRISADSDAFQPSLEMSDDDVKCTILAGADGATKAVELLETNSVFLVVDRARPLFHHCLFFLVRDAR